MSRYKAYPEYQHSGVAWLGETPTSWTLAPLKWFIDRNDGGVWGDDPDGENDTLVLRSTEQTVDGLWKMDDPAPRKLSASDKNFALLRSGDLVVTKSSGSSLHIGKTTIVNDDIERLECCYSNFMQRIRTSRLLLPRLAWYVMNNELSRAQFDFLSNSTTGLANLNGTMIGQIVLAIPSEVEQQAIINFLDCETAKIDALIEKQQRLIELLKEKRQAIISHAVTKGLNPNAPMKDSGVEWLGEVPAHWEVSQLRYVVREGTSITYGIVQAGPEVEEGVPYIRTSDMSGDALPLTGYPKTSPEIDASYARSRVCAGDLVISIRASVGKCLPVPPELDGANLTQGTAKIAPSSKALAVFMLPFIGSSPVQLYLDSKAKGATFKEITLETLRKAPFLVPPVDEQNEIGRWVGSADLRFKALIEAAEQAQLLLKERRTALISAAVTGKIDVRDWQAAA